MRAPLAIARKHTVRKLKYKSDNVSRIMYEVWINGKLVHIYRNNQKRSDFHVLSFLRGLFADDIAHGEPYTVYKVVSAKFPPRVISSEDKHQFKLLLAMRKRVMRWHHQKLKTQRAHELESFAEVRVFINQVQARYDYKEMSFIEAIWAATLEDLEFLWQCRNKINLRKHAA
jgi:hypothetical protein